MIYCTNCGNLIEKCACLRETSSKPDESNKIIDPKKGTGKASKEVVSK